MWQRPGQSSPLHPRAVSSTQGFIERIGPFPRSCQRAHLLRVPSCSFLLPASFLRSPPSPLSVHSLLRRSGEECHHGPNRLARFPCQLWQQSDLPLGGGGTGRPSVTHSLRDGGTGRGRRQVALASPPCPCGRYCSLAPRIAGVLNSIQAAGNSVPE